MNQNINSELESNSESNINTVSQNTKPTEAKRIRRIGTVTLGIFLIITGVVLLAYLFNPGLNIVLIAKFSPAILIMLGLETLYNYFFHKNECLKFDFLSTFFCIILICSTACVTIGVPIYEEFGSANPNLVSKVEHEILDIYQEKLKAIPDITDVNLDLYLNSVTPDVTEFKPSQITKSDHLNLNIFMYSTDYPDSIAFATRCQAVLDEIKKVTDFEPSHVYFQARDKNNNDYTLSLPDPLTWNHDIPALANMTDFSADINSYDSDEISYEEFDYDEFGNNPDSNLSSSPTAPVYSQTIGSSGSSENHTTLS